MDNDYSLQELMANMQTMLKSNQSKLDTYSVSTTSANPKYTNAGVASVYRPDWYSHIYNGDPYLRDNTYTYTTSTTTKTLEEMRYMEIMNRIERMEKTMNDRLCVLTPDPEMLKKWELLQEIYQQYKAAEALLYGSDSDE